MAKIGVFFSVLVLAASAFSLVACDLSDQSQQPAPDRTFVYLLVYDENGELHKSFGPGVPYTTPKNWEVCIAPPESEDPSHSKALCGPGISGIHLFNNLLKPITGTSSFDYKGGLVFSVVNMVNSEGLDYCMDYEDTDVQFCSKQRRQGWKDSALAGISPSALESGEKELYFKYGEHWIKADLVDTEWGSVSYNPDLHDTDRNDFVYAVTVPKSILSPVDAYEGRYGVIDYPNKLVCSFNVSSIAGHSVTVDRVESEFFTRDWSTYSGINESFAKEVQVELPSGESGSVKVSGYASSHTKPNGYLDLERMVLNVNLTVPGMVQNPYTREWSPLSSNAILLNDLLVGAPFPNGEQPIKEFTPYNVSYYGSDESSRYWKLDSGSCWIERMTPASP